MAKKVICYPKMTTNTSSSNVKFIIGMVFAFTVGVLYFAAKVSSKKIKNNWEKYKCSPMIMPFASFYDKDPVENFKHCITKMQTSFNKDALAPLNRNLDSNNSTLTSMAGSLRSMKGISDSISETMNNSFNAINVVFVNFILELRKLVIGVKDSIHKMVGIFTSFIYIIQTAVKTAESTGKFVTGFLKPIDDIIKVTKKIP